MKTLRDINPGAAEMWAYDLNGDMTPDNVSGSSEKTAYFRCLNNPKHLFDRKICKMTSDRDGHNVGCKYCGPNAKEAFPGETDFFTKVREAVPLWDFEQNSKLGLDPTKLLPYSSKKAHFICENGHDEFRKISDFTKAPRCQTCSRSLLVDAPNTAMFLNKKLNTVENISDYIKSDGRIIELACPNCHYTWSWQARLWWKRQYCPHCGYDGTKGSCEKNAFVKEMYHIVTLRDANSEMAALWDYEKNGDATPDNTCGQSNLKFFFNCNNGHKFSTELFNLYDQTGKPLGCPFCRDRTRMVADGINDLVTKFPKILEFWDFEKNDISPNSITARSLYEAKLKCPKGHHFTRKVCLFVADPQCTECKRSEHLRKYSIKTSRPESYKFWDFKKNILDPSITSANSKKEAFWKCPDCGYEWVQRISERCSSRGGKCPSHDLKRNFSQEYGLKFADSFANKNPEASKYWNRELSNGLTPENTPKASGKEIYMNCSRKKHKPYPIKVCNIKKPPYCCPECLREDKEASYRQNSLKFNVPVSVDMWDHDNNIMKLDDALIYMQESANFICGKGHSFTRSIRSFSTNQECPICKMDTVAKHPHMVKQWHFKKNIGYDINLIPAGSKDIVWWRCKKCGYEWQAQIDSRKTSAGHCPCCEERVVVVKGITDLFSLVPNIKEFYDYEANIDINPEELSVTSQIQVNWKCNKCGYRWHTSVGARIVVENGSYKVKSCPACLGQVRTKSYGEEYPELAKKFVDKLNGCSLYDIVESKYSNKNYYWKCDICGEVFESSIKRIIRSINSETKGCSYCAGKKVTKQNSFAALHPEVMDEFSHDNEIDPFTVTEKSGLNVSWICRNNPEHKWMATFYSRANGQGGCNICRGYNYGIMFYEEHSDFEKYYDTENNERPFTSYSNRSNEYVWWKCDKNHSFKWSIINFSRGGTFKCPICSNRQLLVGENDLKSQYPDLALEFDAAKNNILPEEILYTNTDDSIWWLCREGHSFQRSIWYRVNIVRECPICNRTIVVKGINDFQTKYPKVSYVWDYESNIRTPDSISDKSDGKYSFICRRGHHYEIYLSTAKKYHFKCPVCSYKLIQPGINSLVDTDEELSRELSHNEPRKPYELHKYSKYHALWECPICHGDYLYPINERKVGDKSCPYCNNRRVLAHFNSLLAKDNKLAKEWSSNNELAADQVLRTTSHYGLWNCPKCHGEYSDSIRDRYVGDDSCPYCNNRKVLPGVNSLAAVDAQLSKEWSENNEKKPTEYLRSSSYIVFWTCPTCHGDYLHSIRDRQVGDNSCPYCNNQKPLAGYNTLKVKCEDLMREWNYRSNYLIINPDSILPTYSEEVWWICKCGKSYKMSPKKRLYYQKRHMKSCPYCKGRRRKKYRHF